LSEAVTEATTSRYYHDAGKGPEVPTLAIHGRNDKPVHFENSLRLVSLIPYSRLVLLNRCGHWAQLEHAAEFNRLVAGFVAEAW